MNVNVMKLFIRVTNGRDVINILITVMLCL